MQHLEIYSFLPMELAVSNAVCLRDPNPIWRALVGVSELDRVCVLR